MNTIAIYVNKNWECEPFLNALTNYKLRDSRIPFPIEINSPKDGDNHMTDRYRADIQMGDTRVIVRCIQDLMDTGANSSSSENKSKVLPQYIAQDNPDLLFSVSTAAYPDQVINYNGSVFLSQNSFLYNADENNPESHMTFTESEQFFEGACGFLTSVLQSMTDPTSPKVQTVSQQFIAPHRCAPDDFADKIHILFNRTNTVISDINITDYAKYKEADVAAVAAFKKAYPKYTGVSMETTHGVVRWAAQQANYNPKNIIFVSPIVDRLAQFDTEVTDTQNYISAFNGGLAMNLILPYISDFLSGSNTP